MFTQANRSEFRLFLSSTFRDLQAEREYLVKHIFPRVRAVCRERGIEFTAIDLRWGVTDEDASLGRVIRTCLEEVDRCRPYFIALLGERYGWVPSLAEVQKDFQLLQDYPWIEDYAIDRSSLVEIEITAGMLNDPERATGALVYSHPFKPPTNREEARVLALREKIEATGRPVHEYKSLEELGEMVYRDLTAIIERDWPLDANISPLDGERRLHEMFATSRRKAYIANPEYHQALHDFARQPLAGNESLSRPLLVHGVSGSGKSALMAYYSSHFRRTTPKAFVITHFVGASPSGSDAQTILRHIYGELHERYAITDPIPDTTEQLASALPTWLAHIQNESLLLIIDAVNQLPEPDRLLGWLPEYMPPNVRLIVTTTPGTAFDNLSKLGWQQLELKPLGMPEREALIVRFLGEYRKGLGQSQLTKVANDTKAASPLFLRTLLEELRISGEHRLLDAVLDHFLSARDIAELFQFVLERMENDYGRALVADVMSYIATSRHGLSEPELMELTKATRVQLSVLLLALDYHLMNPNGRYTFFHDYLRSAVTKRYLSNPSIDRERHRQLAKYFSGQDISPRRIDEEPWQWKEAGEKLPLVQFLSRLDVLRAYANGDNKYLLLQLWIATGEDFEHVYDDDLTKLEAAGATSDEYLKSLLAVAEFFQTAGKYQRARSLFEQILSRVESQQNDIRLKALNALGQILSDRGDYVESEKYLNEALVLGESLYGAESTKLLDNLDALATLRYTLRNLDESEALFQRALRISQKNEGFVSSKQISMLSNIGAVLYQKGELERAKLALEDALAASERVNGPDHPETAQILNSLGAALFGLKHPQEALPFIERAAESHKRALGPHHANTLSVKLNLGMVAYAQGEYELAIRTYREILPSFSLNQGQAASTTLQVKNNLAMALSANGAFEEAEKLLVQNLEARRSLSGENHSETLICYFNLAKHYAQANRLNEAKKLYELYLPRYSELLGETHHITLYVEEAYRLLLKKLSESEGITSR